MISTLDHVPLEEVRNEIILDNSENTKSSYKVSDNFIFDPFNSNKYVISNIIKLLNKQRGKEECDTAIAKHYKNEDIIYHDNFYSSIAFSEDDSPTFQMPELKDDKELTICRPNSLTPSTHCESKDEGTKNSFLEF
jgi:hypothetical protein